MRTLPCAIALVVKQLLLLQFFLLLAQLSLDLGDVLPQLLALDEVCLEEFDDHFLLSHAPL